MEDFPASARVRLLKIAISGKPIPAVPEAELFPVMKGAELNALVEDIWSRQKIDVPIYVTRDGRVVDGRSRLAAWHEISKKKNAKRISVNFIVVPEDQIAEQVIALNIHRRHLTPAQRADLLAKLVKPMTKAEVSATGGAATKAKAKGKVAPSPAPRAGLTVKQGAKLAGVSERTMKTAVAKARGKKPVKKKQAPLTLAPPSNEPEDPANFRTSFLLRAHLATTSAVHHGPPSQELIDAAKRVVEAWQRVIDEMAKQLERTAA